MTSTPSTDKLTCQYSDPNQNVQVCEVKDSATKSEGHGSVGWKGEKEEEKEGSMKDSEDMERKGDTHSTSVILNLHASK